MQLNGEWNVVLRDEIRRNANLPGTLDLNGIGEEEAKHYTTRLTRVKTYEGKAVFEKTVSIAKVQGTRWFLSVERARVTKVWVNGAALAEYERQTLATPHVYEATHALRDGENLLKIESDNSYPCLPAKNILYSSTATNETQTNWNGLIGELCLYEKPACFISHLRVYAANGEAKVFVELDCAQKYSGTVTLHSAAFLQDAMLDVRQETGTRREYCLDGISLAADVLLWDEGEGNLCMLEASAPGLEAAGCTFGVRTFCTDEHCMLSLNGRPFFVRGEANCAVFPETGHPPMKKDAWLEILRQYAAYGVNCMRFHSWCPPEAAFMAADELGMLMQPELSHWNPTDALVSEEANDYYTLEAIQILRQYANHPSFVMMTLGNELHTNDVGCTRMQALLDKMRVYDPTRLYANSSNPYYGQRGPENGSDFYTSSNLGDDMIRAISSNTGSKLPASLGHINNSEPSSQANYTPVVKRIHREFHVPVFSFEVGQFQVLPDFREINEFTGVTRGWNLDAVKNLAGERGMLKEWDRYVAATGELAAICYREEIEAALRTEGLSGISLLGLQDFPGQGTALVGMMDSHLKPKRYAFADPKRFKTQFSAAVALAILPKYVYSTAEMLSGTFRFVNYGKGDIAARASVTLSNDGKVCASAAYGLCCAARGGLTTIGGFSLDLSFVKEPTELILSLSLGETANNYRVWAYPDIGIADTKGVLIADAFNDQAVQVLQNGGKVFLTPKADEHSFPRSIQGQFSTDFWSMGTFPWQSGCMGLYIDEKHPALKGFPTRFHSDWQWWPMSLGRAMILDDGLECVQPIVRMLDSYCRLNNMAMLFECRVGCGRLMVSSMGLMQNLKYPQVKALLKSILGYMASGSFTPEAELSREALERFFQRE